MQTLAVAGRTDSFSKLRWKSKILSVKSTTWKAKICVKKGKHGQVH